MAGRSKRSRRHAVWKSRHSARLDAAASSRSVGRSFAPGSPKPPTERRLNARRSPSGGVGQGRLEPGVEGLPENRLGVRQHLEAGIDLRLHRPLAQQVGAEPVDGADLGFLEMGDGVLDVLGAGRARRRVPAGRRRSTRALKPLPQAQLQLAGGLLGERHGEDLADLGRARRQHVDDAGDQLRRLPGAGRRLHEEALAERRPDALARRGVDQLGSRRHGSLRSTCRSTSFVSSLRRARTSSQGPHTAR